MKKIVICTLLIAAGTAVLLNIDNKNETQAPEFSLKNSYAYAYSIGKDKAMNEKAVKSAVIDSYFRNVAKNGKIIRWNKSTFPLKVYVQDSADVPEYYRDVVMSAYQAWQRASEGLVSFEFVEDANDADMTCYFKNTDNKKSIGVHSFKINGNKITGSTIVFNKLDNKGHSLDSKQLFASALQEIGHSLGLTGASQSIYDVMYPVGTKFNTEITMRDLNTLILVYAVKPDVTNEPLSSTEQANLYTVSEVLNTLNVPVSNDAKQLDNVVANDISTHLALAEEYRRRAAYSKAAKEYQAVAQMKTDRRSKSEVYCEIVEMYLDAEEFDNAKSAAEIAIATDENDLTDTLTALIDYYTKRSNAATEQLETILKHNPYNKHAYKLLCQIYRDKHQENLLNATIRRYGKTAGEEEEKI